jgi:manganese/zinc/iron transport system permease protein
MLLTLVLWDWWLDSWIICIAILSSLSASLLGNFLILRRASMLSDAISHAVLPGLIGAYLLSGSRQAWTALLGAICVALFLVWLIELIGMRGGVDEGASTGIVFSTLFAIGLVLIALGAEQIDLDPNCVLYGDIELAPLDTINFGILQIPRTAIVLTLALLCNALFVYCYFRPLALSTFDSQFSDSLGWSSRKMHYGIATLTAITSVCSFEAVGNVLIVTMFIVPPAIAFLSCKHLSSMVIVSGLTALVASVLGHASSILVPWLFGLKSTSSAAMISVVCGGLFLLAILFNSRTGIAIQAYRRSQLSWSIVCQDVLALLYRDQEKGLPHKTTREIANSLLLSPWLTWLVLTRLKQKGYIVGGPVYCLNELGKQQGQTLIRSHRLWEQFLSMSTATDAARLHAQAETLEHFTNPALRQQLDKETQQATSDPHGKSIPPEA